VLGKCLGGPKAHVKARICELSVEVVEVVAGGPGSHRVGAAILTMWQLFVLFLPVTRGESWGIRPHVAPRRGRLVTPFLLLSTLVTTRRKRGGYAN